MGEISSNIKIKRSLYSFVNYQLSDIPLSITVVSFQRIALGSSFDPESRNGGDLEISLPEYCEIFVWVYIPTYKRYVFSCLEVQQASFIQVKLGVF